MLYYLPSTKYIFAVFEAGGPSLLIMSGSYLEQISHQLTSMSAQENVPKKQNVRLLKLNTLFLKGSLMKLIKISVLTTTTTANMETQLSVLTLLLTKLQNIQKTLYTI